MFCTAAAKIYIKLFLTLPSGHDRSRIVSDIDQSNCNVFKIPQCHWSIFLAYAIVSVTLVIRFVLQLISEYHLYFQVVYLRVLDQIGVSDLVDRTVGSHLHARVFSLLTDCYPQVRVGLRLRARILFKQSF